MRFAEIRGLNVVSVGDARKLGTVDDLYLDNPRRQVLAFRVKTGGLIGGHQVVALEDVQSIGQDAFTIADASKLNAEDRFAQLKNSVRGGDIIGSRVMTEGGSEIGTVGDVEADFATGEVTGFELRGGLFDRLQHRERVIPVSGVHSMSDKLLVVAKDAVPA